MRRFRMFGAGVTIAALLGAVASTGTAGAATPTGVGTSKATDSILKVALGSNGSLLNLRLLGDDGSASIDPTVAKPSSASSGITAASVTSSISALNLGSIGVFNAQSTGDPKTVNAGPVSLALPTADAGVLKKGVVTNGSIDPATLTAAVDTAGAKSGLDTTLKSVSVAGGLLALGGTSNLGANALTGDADGLRGVNIPSVQVLNLGALLKGLGIDVTQLSLDTVTSLLNQLQATVGVDGSSLSPNAVKALIDGITTQVTTLTGLDPASALSAVPGGDPTSTITGLLPAGAATPTTVGDALTALQDQLTALLNSVLSSLTGAPLLEVDNVVAGLKTKAADTIANSVASVTATVGAVKVGNVSVVQNLDLAGAADQLTATVTAATAAVNAVLANVNLSGLVSLKVLDQTKNITSSGGYVHAVAGLTALHAAVTPPANLAAIVGGLNNVPVVGAAAEANPISGLFPQGSSADPVSAAMSSLNAALVPNGLGALAQGATVDAVQLSSTSDFAVGATPANPAAPTAVPAKLAATGGPTQVLGLLGLLLLAIVVALRWLRRPATH